jgi:hypothetical protein
VDSAKWSCARSALDNGPAAAFAGEHLEQYLNAPSRQPWLSSITETLRTWRYVMQETYECPETRKTTSSFVVAVPPHDNLKFHA